jgi:hypothetical protein
VLIKNDEKQNQSLLAMYVWGETNWSFIVRYN